MTSAQLQAALNVIDAAIGSATLTVEYAGRRVTYQSVGEMIKAADYFRRRLAEVAPSTAAPMTRERTTYATFSQD